MADAIPFPSSSPAGANASPSKNVADVVTEVAVQAIDAVDKGAAAAQGLLERGVDNAHSAIGRVADTAGPAMQRVQDGVQAAGSSLKAKAEDGRQYAEELTEKFRSNVRANPVTAVAAALAAGYLIARITR
jgi:hypothetical protein